MKNDSSLAKLGGNMGFWLSLLLGLGLLLSQGELNSTENHYKVETAATVFPMEIEAVRACIQQAADAWMTGNALQFVNLFDADGEFIAPGNRWVGKEAIRQAFEQFMQEYSEIKITIRQVLVDGDRVAVEWQWQETEKSTQKRNLADDAILVDFQNGLIQRWREYIDTATPKVER
jgi:uncharacterized protein (TIGR02246 family)